MTRETADRNRVVLSVSTLYSVWKLWNSSSGVLPVLNVSNSSRISLTIRVADTASLLIT